MRSEVAGLALAVLAAFVAASALQAPGYYDSHDGLLNVHRLYELEGCIADGQVPCRWVPDMGRGYGYPLFNFYPPLGTHVSLLLRGLGAGPLAAVKGAMALALVVAAVGMFALARRRFGPRAAAVAAVLYVLAPYVAVDVYVRGALAETWGIALVPWVFLAGERVARGDGVAGPLCAMAWLALLLAHPLTASMVGVLYATWLAFLLWREAPAARPAALARLAGAHALALGLAAWFVAPSLLELDQVHAETLTTLYPWARYENNFLRPAELLAPWPAWGYAPFRSPGGMALFLGPMQLLAAVAAAVTLALRWRADRLGETAAAVLLLGGGGLLTGVLTLTVARPLWDAIPPLAWLQFPWRFLSIATFGAAFAGGALVWTLAPWPRVAAATTALLCVASVATAWTWFQPKAMHAVADDALASRREVARSVHGLYDFLPAGVDLARFRAAPPPPAPPPASSEDATLSHAVRRSDRLEVEARVEGDAPATVRFESFAFPGWSVAVDGEPVPLRQVDDPFARLHVQVPPGRHRVSAQLSDTPVRMTANLVSAACGLAWLAWMIASVRATARRAGAGAGDGRESPEAGE